MRNRTFFENLGAPMIETAATLTDAARLYFQMFVISFERSARSGRRTEVFQSIVQIAIGSLPIITIATACSGMVITNEIAFHMDKALHDISLIPGSTAQLVLRELGIVIPALLMVSKVGAAITAEIGSMKVTEQLDALKLLQIDPVRYLVFPRWVAAVFAGFSLTLVASFMTLACAILIAVLRYNFSFHEYLNAMRHFIGVLDLLCAITKGVIFGSLIPVISCAYGFRCKGGAQGVGGATTQAVVSATLAVIIFDFLLTGLFSLIL